MSESSAAGDTSFRCSNVRIERIIRWKQLSDQFQKKTWANKLELQKKLYSLRLHDGESVQTHIKEMTELFETLAVVGDTVSDEDRVVYLLASLPESFNMLVTALEASSENVPKMEIVTERLLHEERKLKEKGAGDDHSSRKAFLSKQKRGNPSALGNPSASGNHRRQQLVCHYCKKPGHFKRNCRKLAASQRQGSEETKSKHSTNSVAAKEQESSSTDDEAMVVGHALSATSRESSMDSQFWCHLPYVQQQNVLQ